MPEFKDYTISKEQKKRVNALPKWVNRSALWRYLLGEDAIIRFRCRSSSRSRGLSRSKEVREILDIALPALEKLTKNFDKIIQDKIE